MINRKLLCKLLCIVSFALGAAAPAAAQQPIQALDVFELEHANDPRISPDGDEIVYVRNFADIQTDERYSNLWVVNFDGSGHRALTDGNINAHTPRWSPDGSKLAYISNAHIGDDKDAKPQIYVRDMASGDVSMISNFAETPAGIAWSPDGSQIAFTMLVPEDAPKVADLPEAPEGSEWKEGPFVTDKLVYRFDGAGYLPNGYHHIFVVPSDGGTPRQISSGDYHHGGPGLPGRRADALSWTPDGASIVLSANRRDDVDMNLVNTDVYSFRVRDGRVSQLTDRDGSDSDAAVSPDGRWVAYRGFDDQRLSFQVRKLYVQRMNGRDRRVLTEDLDRTVIALKWAPDSEGVYIAYDHEGVTHLAHVDLDGAITPIADHLSGSGGYSVYGGAAQFTVGSNGRVAAIHADTAHIEDIAAIDDGGLRRITDLNGDLLSQRTLGEVETIWYESSIDGRRVQGWLVYPPDFDPRRNYPLMIEIHGGPFTNYGERFDFDMQYFAAQGFLVLYTNPRGSTSYGEDFANLIHHNYPSDDFYDLMSGVDAVIEKGIVDTDRLYVAGGSGGGVLTTWTIGRSDRFAAAVAYYPVINWESFILTTDIPYINNYWFPGPPWEHRDHYWSRSLLSVVENVSTPTLLITGEADWRTPISQTEEYYTALKILGVETMMIRIPDEPHLTRVHPSHFMTRLVNTAAWFDRYQ